MRWVCAPAPAPCTCTCPLHLHLPLAAALAPCSCTLVTQLRLSGHIPSQLRLRPMIYLGRVVDALTARYVWEAEGGVGPVSFTG